MLTEIQLPYSQQNGPGQAGPKNPQARPGQTEPSSKSSGLNELGWAEK